MKSSNSRKTKYVSGALVGAGGGTLIVLLVKNLPENSQLKQYLIVIAPSISVVFSFLWDKILIFIDDYVKEKFRQYSNKRFRKVVDKYIKNPNIPDDMKSKMLLRIAELETAYLERWYKNIYGE